MTKANEKYIEFIDGKKYFRFTDSDVWYRIILKKRKYRKGYKLNTKKLKKIKEVSEQ